jgi:hypothetical protein
VTLEALPVHSWWSRALAELPLLVVLGVPGYMLARTYVHALTRVDPSNFNTTILLFTPIIAYLLLMLVHVMLAAITGLGALVRGVWVVLTTRRPRWPTESSGWMDIIVGVMLVVFVYSVWKRACVEVIHEGIDVVAKYVLVRYEFSYDPTCAVSMETRWVAPLKDRKEMKASNVLIAIYSAWDDIRHYRE